MQQALTQARNEGTRGPVFELTYMGARTFPPRWSLGERLARDLEPWTAIGPNMSEQWLPEGAIEHRGVRLCEQTLSLELQRYRFADEIEWALRALLDGEPLVLTEERTETSMGNTEATTIVATARTGKTPIVYATLFGERVGMPRAELHEGKWVLHAERRRSGAAHNTVVYDRLTQTFTVDLAARSAHMLTSYYVDTTS